jgi:NAD(P)-dependent dehydrogenase (short-subunit alcohol dehydrogenase family)
MAPKDDIEIPNGWPSFTKTWHTHSYPAISPSQPKLSAAGKNVIVTGGGTGIGKSIAIAFAEAGASSVTILGRREDRLKTSTQAIAAKAPKTTKVHYEVTDLTKRSDVDRALQSIITKFGTISIFVSNAGGIPALGHAADMDPDVFMSGFETNVRTALNSIQAFLPLAAQDAILISVSTGLAHIAPVAGMSAYSTSKAANLKMLDYFAAENPGVRFVSLHPGVVDTEINEGTSLRGQDNSEFL